MFQHQGIWLPDGEKHFVEWMNKSGQLVDGRGTYQYKKWLACLPWIKEFRNAVDVGAHVGLWSMHMADKFYGVVAFEPMTVFRDCFHRNVDGGVNVTLLPQALGSESGTVSMDYRPDDSGGTHIKEGKDVEMLPLDAWNFDDVDFIKIDCEGAELDVVKGAVELLDRCKPCVIVEQKQHIMGRNFGTKGTPAVDFLRERGAVLRKEMGGDYILSWPS